MSDPSTAEPALPSAARRSGWLTALMFLGGILLLLPGVCALAFVGVLVSDGGGGGDIGGFVLLWLVCLLISASGVVLLVRAVRGRRPPRHG